MTNIPNIQNFGTNCAPLVADLFVFCYERDFILSLSHNNQTDIIEAFNSTSRYLDDLLNIDNPYFEQMVDQIYPTELQLNKANSSNTEAPFLDLNLSITNGIASSKNYDKQDDFNFEIVNFPFLDGDVPRSPSYGIYISQLIRFARVCSNVDAFTDRSKEVLLLWIFYVFVLSCVCYVFVRVCLYVLCGLLLGKG